MPHVVSGAAGLNDLMNVDLGATEWTTLSFETIEAFADATGDHQWIHVDRERIAKESPFGAPIAHGYYTLSLVAGRFFELLELAEMAMVINYGTNKVRFPSPLKEGDRSRLSIRTQSVTEKGKGWIEVIFLAAIEVEGSEKPACSAEVVYRFLPA